VSTTVCIFEDRQFHQFFPLSLGQAVFDLRIGAGTLRSRWTDPKSHTHLICRDYLADVVRLSSPGLAVNGPVSGAASFVNGRLLCMGDERKRWLGGMGDDSVAVQGGVVVAARVGKAAAAEFADALRVQVSDAAVANACELLRSRAGGGAGSPATRSRAADGTEVELPKEVRRVIEARSLRIVEVPEARLLSFPWQLIEHNAACIADDFERLPARGQAADSVVFPGVHIVSPERVVVGRKASIRAGVVLDASDGPVIVGDGAVVMPNATVLGPVAIGAGSVVKAGARILGGTSIGSVCKVGGEVDETIFSDYSNKQHDGFLGHSYVGAWVNIGAASNNSDLKNNYGLVRMWCAGEPRETGRQFLGLVMGDHTKTGINAVFNTGTVVGFNCNVYSSEMPGSFVPSFSWGHGLDMVPYDLEKAMHTAALAMERRGVEFTAAHRRLFEHVHDLVTRSGRNA
jgi:UDP-N-acetylglucosamine diphosphorylase/glucosamine-1-phosphate N-acetyltransferase